MIGNLISTTAARLLIALGNLAILIIATRYIGAAGIGTVSLLILGISINQMVSSFVGGSVLVYLVPRHALLPLLLPSAIWAIFVSFTVSWVLKLFGLVPTELFIHLIGLSLLQAGLTISQNVLLGKEKVLLFNAIALLQTATMLSAIIVLMAGMHHHTVMAYVKGLYASFSLAMLSSSFFMLKYVKKARLIEPGLIRQLFRFGGYLQSASLMQLFNYRLSYYIIEKSFNRATLGLFSIGVQVAESLWIVSRSIAMVQYSRISNSNDPVANSKLTIDFIKLTTIITLSMLAILLILPASFFTFIFSRGFEQVTAVLLSLSPGILAVAVSNMFSHYFSGSGQPWHNTISSGIGLVFTVILGFSLIPVMGVTGAGLTASVAYLSGMLYQIVVFKRATGTSLRNFIPRPQELSAAWSILKHSISSKDKRARQ